MTQLTYADITKTTLRHIYGDPERLAQALAAACGPCPFDDGEDHRGEMVKSILEVCKEEGIDPLPAIKIAMRPSPLEAKILGKGSGGSHIHIPFTYKETS